MSFKDWGIYDDDRHKLLCHKHVGELPGPMVSEDGYAVGSVDGIVCCWRCGKQPPEEMLFVGRLANCFFPEYTMDMVISENNMRDENQKEFLDKLGQRLEEGLDT